ncbi:hypothetical protein RSK20926_20995 [Roseobacter sp. SK209-2-6]|uniref:GNAT family N-acetyltransferase n=1 Tax=Roseobacter sp. SK209-2-6 TaxID=388739 RepID=UPI0000F3E7C2|nr:GNAT family N-acetyltransferase [Roseobacter sp. SK209-2-6]EBA16243.1 hypothetical protein RSK20926_20995 [Roseobacter sp. SK209-2-6]
MFDFLPADVMPRPIQRDTTPPSLPQSPEFRRALLATGQSPLVLENLGDTLVTRRRFALGVSCAMVNRARIKKPLRLIESLQEQGLGRTPVILSPEEPAAELAQYGAVPLLSPAHVAKWDLSSDRDSLRAGLHQKWRNRLKHAEAHTLRISRQNMPIDPSHWLLQADQKQQAARGYSSWPQTLTLAYASENPGQAKLFQAFEGKEVIAALLILRHGAAASYHISHSTARGKALSAHNLLLWQAACWLQDKGCQHLDLGLINTEHAAGLARFKLGTGAALSALGGTWLHWPPVTPLFAPLARLDLRKMHPA